jgi:hypothetical protein
VFSIFVKVEKLAVNAAGITGALAQLMQGQNCTHRADSITIRGVIVQTT